MSVRSLRYNTMNQHITKSALASTDRDALAFLEAAQVYNTNQQRAIVNLVRSLKRVGLWSKMKAIYPFVGGTATSHKWNLKDPQDTDAAFRLTFSGGWTHSANGADPNGTNGYADTYFIPASYASSTSLHGSIYVRENTNVGVDYGGGNNLTTNDMAIVARLSGNAISDLYDYASNRITVANADARGYYIQSRTSSTSHKFYKNSAQIGNTDTTTATGFTNLTFQVSLGAFRASENLSTYTDRQFAFATFGDGLTDTDATNLYNIVDLYQKRLGRAV